MLSFLEIIIAVLFTFFAVQTVKLATDGIKGNYSFRSIITTYGGMPSSHTAFVIALTTLVGYREGIGSTTFGIALVFSLIVIVDAVYLRKFINDQAIVLKKLIQRLPADQRTDYPPITTGFQHTPLQVLIGAFIGFGIASLVHWLV